MASKNFAVNGAPFSIRTLVGRTDLLTQCPKKIGPTVIARDFVVDITLVNFQNVSVIMKMYWMPLCNFSRGRRMLMAMSSSGCVAVKNDIFGCRFLVRQLCTQDSQPLTVL